jgi:uncharacterized membrane protein YedE/YeeE
MKNISVFISGLVFGIGLIISGMSNPYNVIGFLDLAGNWNPSLAFVMIGAVGVTLIFTRWVVARQKTIFNDPLHLPDTTKINKELVIGGFIFGAGWAIAGFCPGPAVVALGAGYLKALVFVIAMIAGMLLHDHGYKRKTT